MGSLSNHGPGLYDDFDIDSDLAGNPILAIPYFDFNGFTELYKFNGNAWSLSNHDSTATRRASLAINPLKGTTYLAYMRGGPDNASPTAPARIDTLAGNLWKPLGTAGWNVAIEAIDFQLDPSGIPYYAYVDYPSYKVAVKKFTGTWVDVGTTGFSEGKASLVKITFQGSTPVVAYRDATYAKAVVKAWNGTTWEPLGLSTISNGDVNRIVFLANATSIWLGCADASNENRGSFSQRVVP